MECMPAMHIKAHPPCLPATKDKPADRPVSSGQLCLPIADKGLGQNHINTADALPERSMSSEPSDTKPTPDKAPTTTKPDRLIPKHIFLDHEGWIPSFVFLHDNVHIVSGSSDGTMSKWDCDTGLLVGEPWEEEGKSIFALALSPNGKTIACGRVDGVQMWNTDGKMSKGIWMGESNYVRSVSWSPMGGYIASGSYDGTILIRKAGSGEVEVGPIETKQDKVWSLAYSPSGNKIASGGYNGTICIWDSSTGELLVDPIEDLGSTVDSVVWSSDSSTLYSASDSFARVFDSISGAELHRFEHDSSLYSIALSPTHNALACVGCGNITRLWDTESHQTLCQSLSGTDEDDRRDRDLTLCCVSFSRDGRYLAYSGDDQKITLWMVQDIAPELVVCALITILQGNKLHSRKFDFSSHHYLASKSVLYSHT